MTIIKKQYRSLISIILSFVLLFTLFSPQHVKAESLVINGVQIEKVVDNDKELVFQGTKDGATLILTQDKNTLNVLLTGDQKLFQERSSNSLSMSQSTNFAETDPANFEVTINSVENDKIDATFKNIETQEVNSTIPTKSTGMGPQLVFLVPLGVVVGEALIAALLASAVAVTLGGVVWTTVGSVKEKIRNSNYDHFAAKIMQGYVFIGPAISLPQATARLSSTNTLENNVWSKNSTYAAKVARLAGGGKTPIGPELQVNQVPNVMYYVHYHTWNRVGGHSFF